VAYQLEVSGVAGVDLCVEEVRLSSERVAAGEALRADVTVCQLRDLEVRDVSLRFLLSEDDSVDDEDVQLGEDLVVDRIPGAGRTELRRRLRLPAGAENGARFVLVQIDPEAGLADLNRGNNQGTAPLTIVPACVDDDLRTNEGPLTATPLEPEASPFEAGVICAHTQDWYALPVAAPGQVEVRLGFVHAAGDLDLFLHRLDGGRLELLGSSETEGDEEVVSVEMEAAGDLLVQVSGFDDAEAPYTLEWSLP